MWVLLPLTSWVSRTSSAGAERKACVGSVVDWGLVQAIRQESNNTQEPKGLEVRLIRPVFSSVETVDLQKIQEQKALWLPFYSPQTLFLHHD